METEELLENWKNFRLSEEERVTKIDFDPQLRSLIDGQLDHCLVGKLLTTRTVVPGIIKKCLRKCLENEIELQCRKSGKESLYFQSQLKNG